MSKLLLSVAVVMLSYDCLGHLCAFTAESFAARGSAQAAYLWNTYSIYVWPRIVDRKRYNLYWAVWHGVTVTLFITAYLSKST